MLLRLMQRYDEAELADAPVYDALRQMLLLVVVGCTSKQSVS